MAELEPGHPDELKVVLTNWLNRASDPIGSLPEGVTPVEWAVRNFVDVWRKPVRLSIDTIEASLKAALEAIEGGNPAQAKFEIECCLQTIGEDLRDDLGIYEWNRESE
jgi:hypothetical protein